MLCTYEVWLAPDPSSVSSRVVRVDAAGEREAYRKGAALAQGDEFVRGVVGPLLPTEEPVEQ